MRKAGPASVGWWARVGRLCAALFLLASLGVSRGTAQSAASLPLLSPTALAYDTGGNLFIADARRHQVLEATLAGTLLVVAGTGQQGFSGDGSAATAAELNQPTALAVDASGALLVCDTADHRVRRISNGVITTVAGTGVQGFGGEGGPATAAEFDSPMGLAVAADGRVWIADTHNQRVRLVDPSGIVRTIAGTGQPGYAGDGGPATAAQLLQPRGLTVATDGALLIADAENQRVRRVDASGVISTLAGSGTEGAATDGISGAESPLHAPRSLTVSRLGFPALADTMSGTVRLLTSAGTLYQPAALAPGRLSGVSASWGANQTYGQAQVGVTVSGAVGVPQGLVTLSEGGATMASASLQGGAATLALPALAVGPHTLVAAYAGDGLNPASTGGLRAITITGGTLTATAQAATMSYGQPVPPLSGTLNGVLPQDAGQVSATFSTGANSLSPPGTYPITVALTGPKAANYALNLATGSGALTITRAVSVTALSGAAQGYAGLPLRLSANVTSATRGQPTGTVQFLDGGTVVAMGTVVNGSASGVYLAPPAGSLNLTAQYNGDTDFAPSSSAVQVAVLSTLPDFALSPTGPSTVTVPAGNVATFTISISAQPAPFTGDVTLSATGLPKGATVSFSPPQVVPGSGFASVTVSVQTPAPSAALRPSLGRQVLAWTAVLFCGGLAARRRSCLAWLAICLLGASLSLGGCGARTVGEPDGQVATATYLLGITGTSTNLVGAVVTHSTAVTLVVQQ